MYRRSLTKNLHRFEEIVVVGTHQKQWMLEHGCNPERVHVIPCGVPTEQFAHAVRRLLGNRSVHRSWPAG